jgi:hypothetical protein
MRLHCIRTLTGLVPCDERDRDLLSKIKIGKQVSVEVKQSRNIGHHRKLFAMLQIILDNQDHYTSVDQLLNVCKLRIGHVETVQTKHGLIEWPASISWASMDQSTFEDFYNRAVNWACSEVIPGLATSELNSEVEQRLLRF